MHCAICDYSPLGTTAFNNSHNLNGGFAQLKWDRRYNSYTCSDCFTAGEEDLLEFGLPEDVTFNDFKELEHEDSTEDPSTLS